MQNRIKASLALLAVLAACSGNPFVTTPVDPTDPTTPVDPTDPTAAVKVDSRVALDVRAINYSAAGGGTLTMNIAGLSGSGTPTVFTRDGTLDIVTTVPGQPNYQAFVFQEAATRRSYIALVAGNSRNSVVATSVSDGGQFNRHFAGGGFARMDVYSAPTGEFSYAGTYAGVFAPGDATSNLPAGLVANRPYRVTGDALINANFGNSKVDGGVVERWILDANGDRIDLNLDGVVDDDDKLLDITFPAMDIYANGQFLGDVEASVAPGVPVGGEQMGTINGVFGGTGATDVAGAIIINPLPGDTGVWEHGVFNLPRCGLAGAVDAPICNPGPP